MFKHFCAQYRVEGSICERDAASIEWNYFFVGLHAECPCLWHIDANIAYALWQEGPIWHFSAAHVQESALKSRNLRTKKIPNRSELQID